MPTAARVYRTFYLQGREDIRHDGIEAEIDIAPMVEKVLEGGGMHQTTQEAAKLALGPLWLSEKTEYLADNKEEIAAAGGDVNKAFAQYMEGRTDEFRKMLEEEVVEAMHTEFEEEEDEDDDDDEGDDDSDDDDGDDDEEEDVDDDEDDDDDDEEDEPEPKKK